MRVEEHERERLAGGPRVGAQLAEDDRVVAAEHDRDDAALDERLEALGDLLHRALGVARA